MHDELSVLKLVTARLDTAGIAYMVTGSVALSLYAEPRMTRDVDLVVELRPTDAVRFVDLFGAEFTCDADRIATAIASRSMFNLIHTAAVVRIDVIVRKDTPYREEEFRRRRLARIDGAEVWVVSAEDLILSKLDWARSSRSEVQLKDSRNVIAAFRTLVMQRSESERAMMAFEMFDMARALVTADIRVRYPGITDDELRVQIFERTYGNDFNERDRDRIVKRIRAAER